MVRTHFLVDQYEAKRTGQASSNYIETSCSLGVLGEGVLFATAAP